MSEDPQGFLFQVVFALVCVLGGFRFRRWAVAGRSRVPRFSTSVESVVCWSIYSLVVSFCVFWGSHWLFEYHQLAVQ